MTYKGRQIRFSRTIHRKLAGHKGVVGCIQCDKSEKYAYKNSVSSKVSFKIEGEIKRFPYKQKLNEFVTTKPALQEILSGNL